MVIESSGHQMITNCAHHGSLFQQMHVLLMKTEVGLLTSKKEKLRTVKEMKLHF